jgi:hypothetical protein
LRAKKINLAETTVITSHAVPPPDPKTNPKTNYDLWGVEAKKTVKLPRAKPQTLQKRLRSTLYVPSLVPAVEVPHPGLSYNPSFTQHQELLKETVAKVTGKVKGPKPRKKFAPEDVPVIKEETEDDDDDKLTSLRAPPPARKTAKQKRKEVERRKEEEKRRVDKTRKIKENEVFRVKSLKKQIERKENIIKERLTRRVKVKLVKEKVGVKELGKNRFDQTLEGPLLSGEISGNLRGVQQQGCGGGNDLLSDRFKSLQKRNILEITKKVGSVTVFFNCHGDSFLLGCHGDCGDLLCYHGDFGDFKIGILFDAQFMTK